MSHKIFGNKNLFIFLKNRIYTFSLRLKDITNKIALGIKSKNLNLFSAFLILDIDNDNIISFEDFEKSMLNTLNLRINTTEL